MYDSLHICGNLKKIGQKKCILQKNIMEQIGYNDNMISASHTEWMANKGTLR